MKRLLSILLMLLFGLPLVQPLLAQDGEALTASLPACCRRAGAHKCAMSMEQAAAQVAGTRWSARPDCCPQYPQAAGPAQHHDVSAAAAGLLQASIVAQPADTRQVEAQARASVECARHKRGPPAVELS